MYNDFVLIGPKADPAAARGAHIVGLRLKESGSERAVCLAR